MHELQRGRYLLQVKTTTTSLSIQDEHHCYDLREQSRSTLTDAVINDSYTTYIVTSTAVAQDHYNAKWNAGCTCTL
eukprot:2602324-Amphidinium_carterae.4